VILITNMKTFLEAMGVNGGLASVIYVLIVVVWLTALVHSIIVNRRERKASMEAKVVPT
jgi:preprotein translocase subunit SecG